MYRKLQEARLKILIMRYGMQSDGTLYCGVSQSRLYVGTSGPTSPVMQRAATKPPSESTRTVTSSYPRSAPTRPSQNWILKPDDRGICSVWRAVCN